jgi:ACS family hexuronate transporter-like MFS transporter
MVDPHERTSPPVTAATFHAWWITILLLVSMTVNFMDRLVLGAVAPTLQSTLHFSSTQYSYVVFAFTLGMTLGQLPAGAFIDRVGFRAAMPSLFAGWSLANALQALGRTVSTFSGLRFVMGVFECGNYSAGVKAVGELFPEHLSAFALGIFNSGSILGSAIAPPAVVFITVHYGWRAAFLLPSLTGLVWLAPWFASCRPYSSRPVEKLPAGDKAISLAHLLRPRQVWGVILMRASSGPLTTFYWFWLPLYLVRGRGLTLASMAGLASAAYLLGGIGQAGGGYFSGWLVRRGRSVDAARKLTCTLGGVIAAVGTFLVAVAGSVGMTGVLAGMGILGANIMSNMQIAVITDVFPRSVQARVTSMTGFGEGLVNMGMSLSTGFLVDHFSFVPVFMTAAALPVAALWGLFAWVRRCQPLSTGEILRAAG